MLTTKKWPFRMGGVACGLVLAGLLAGCTPPGPRALEQGSKLIEQGKYSAAVRKLRIATSKLPEEAVAWNHLGLAYHKLGETNQALGAYQKALRFDSHLAAAHYNLGALYFERNNYPEAIRSLADHVRLQPESANGWLKLGIVQRRAGILDEAQKSLNYAESLAPSNPRIFNELGLVQLENQRPDLAMRSFARAVNLNTNDASAVLNLAVVAHRYTSNLNYALGRYRQYLAIEPTPPSAGEVSRIVARLEARLASLEEEQSSVPAETEPAESGREVAEAAPEEPAETASEPEPKIEFNLPPSTNLLAAASGPVAPGNLSAPESDPLEGLVLTASLKPAPIPPPADTQAEPLPLKTNLIEIDETLIHESSGSEGEGGALPPGVTPLEPIGEETPTRTSDAERASFLERMNPGRWFRSRESQTPDTSETATTSQPRARPGSQTTPGTGETTMEPAAREETSTPESRAEFSRYVYQEWTPPAPGSRVRAETYFVNGFRAQQRRQYDTAIEQYRLAVRWDPAYYEAYYNMGICGLLSENYSRALDSFERALVLQPDSRAARYNFALALQRANYPLDAVEVFQDVLEESPEDERVHLALANLHAQVLNQPDRARRHYLKVLEINSNHPQAPAIRYWLQRHPEGG